MEKFSDKNVGAQPQLEELQSAREAKVARLILIVLGIFFSGMSIMFHFSWIVDSAIPTGCCAAIAILNCALACFAPDRVAHFVASLLGF
jgi:hypothetical protein